MKGRLMPFIWVVVLVASLSSPASAKAIEVVSTIGMITDVAKEIGGDKVNVQGLMGAGVDPHLYKATESDVNKLAKADIIFYNGLYLEAKMEKIFEQMSRTKKVVAVSERNSRSKLLDSVNYPGHYDPHVWFDVSLWINAAEVIADTFVAHDPANKDYYVERVGDYLKELEELNGYVAKRADELPEAQRVLITAHDAFRYFGRKYGFEVKGLQGLSTETEAGTKDVVELAKFIIDRKIRAIFVETSVPERNIRAVQDAVNAEGWNVEIGGELFSDAMGTAGTIEGTYIGMVRHNIDTIVDALQGKSQNHDN